MYNDSLYNDCPFLSTPSARRATPERKSESIGSGISIHALREEGDIEQNANKSNKRQISIHALREEGDSSKKSSQN